MVENPKYILTEDTEATFSRIGVNVNPLFARAVDKYLTGLASSLGDAFDSKVDIKTYPYSQIEKALKNKVIDELETDPNTVCICLDRFLLTDIETSDTYQQRFFRFDICRSLDNKKMPRQGGSSFPEQLESLRQAIPELDSKKLVVVDSGVFSGGTIKDFLELLSTGGIKPPIKKVICFIGNQENLKDQSVDSLEIIEPVKNLHDWIDVRDFSPFGGKTLRSSRSNEVSATIPYLYPWSDGSNASLDMSPRFFSVSQDMITAFRELVMAYEGGNGNKPLTFRELVKNGFPLPTNGERKLPISINDSVVQYLDRCVKLIEYEQSRPVAIFDMDGTLYQLDGKDNGFSGSTLSKVVLQNAREFIKVREGCDDDYASTVIQAGLKDSVGLSAYLSRKYGISRLEYFNHVWDISPDGIVENDNQIRESILSVKKNPQIKIILLTHAPRVWAHNVLNCLGIAEFFESLYTGEQHGQKEEVFDMLAGRYRPKNIISIGDQYETDIEPAQKLGMRTFQVKTPKDLKQLSSILSTRY